MVHETIAKFCRDQHFLVPIYHAVMTGLRQFTTTCSFRIDTRRICTLAQNCVYVTVALVFKNKTLNDVLKRVESLNYIKLKIFHKVVVKIFKFSFIKTYDETIQCISYCKHWFSIVIQAMPFKQFISMLNFHIELNFRSLLGEENVKRKWKSNGTVRIQLAVEIFLSHFLRNNTWQSTGLLRTNYHSSAFHMYLQFTGGRPFVFH